MYALLPHQGKREVAVRIGADYAGVLFSVGGGFDAVGDPELEFIDRLSSQRLQHQTNHSDSHTADFSTCHGAKSPHDQR